MVPYDSTYFVAGNCGPGRKLFFSKIDKQGSKEWYQIYPVPGYTYYIGGSGSLFRTLDNNYAIIGTKVPSSGLRGYGIILKVDALGNKKWEKEYGVLDDIGFQSITSTKDSGFIFTGDGFISGSRFRYLLLKTDSLGNLQWYQTYTDNHPQRNYEGTSVIQTPDKGYCFGGRGGYWGTQYYYSIAEIFKTDSLGNLQWKKTFGNPLYCNLDAMLCLSKDNCIVTSYILGYSGIPSVYSQAYIAKYGLDGSEKWTKKIGDTQPNNWVSWINSLVDGGFIISGSHMDKDTINKYKGWLFKLNNNGDSLWYREYVVIDGINDRNQLYQVTPTPDKGFAAAGSLYPNSSGGGQDIWVFKTDSMGCLVPYCDGVGITEFNTNAGAQMVVYPNPFTNAFAINYNIPAGNKEAVFQLYDIYGKLVYQTGLTTNVNQLQVVASSLKAGMYVACLVVDGKKIASQIIIKE
jgi:hypothetical protein